MFDQKNRPEYLPLNPSESYDESPDDENPSSARHTYENMEGSTQSSTPFTISRPTIYASMLLIFLSILNGALLPVTLPKYKSALLTQAELNTLTYPTQGIGLDRAAKLIPQPPMWTRAWPSNITRLSQKLKNAIYGDGVQVFISVEDSTIFRFPVPASRSNSKDCTITWVAPPSLSARASDLHTKGDISEIEVWSIISPSILQTPSSQSVKKINFNELSWNMRPIRGELLGTLDLNSKPNSTTVVFGCPEDGEDLVIEMRCLRVACEVNFKQMHMVPTMGFELIRKD